MAPFRRRSRWFVVQALFSCWLAVLLAATVPLSLAAAPVLPLLNQAGFDTKTSPFADRVKPLSAGKYELAKVRILGVPAIQWRVLCSERTEPHLLLERELR